MLSAQNGFRNENALSAANVPLGEKVGYSGSDRSGPIKDNDPPFKPIMNTIPSGALTGE